MNKIKQLSEIKSDIEDTHTTGKISDEHYANLKNEVSTLSEEIFKERMKSLNNLSEDDRVKLLVEIKDELSDAYSKEMINELHYSLLKEKLSRYEK